MRKKGFVTILVIVFLVVNSFVLFYFTNGMRDEFIGTYSDSVEENKEEYFENYINEIGHSIENEMDEILRELSLFGNVLQTYYDNSDEFSEITEAMKSTPYFKDKMEYSGIWHQNTPDEPALVHVQRYLLDENNEIKAEVKKHIDNTIVLDLLFPSILNYGIEKQLVYVQGPVDSSFARMSPWVDLGNLMNDVYPAYTDLPTWETFNPGLVGQWEDKIKSSPEAKKDNRLLMKISPPVQDGVTGQMVLTCSYPLWDIKREKFEGSLGYDVPIGQVLNMVEDVKIEESGFAFLSQSNSNLFAVNEIGSEILGFGSVEEHTDVTGEGIGFNRLNRFFSESKYLGVQGIDLPGGEKIISSEISINNVEYTLVLKRLKPFQTWYPEKSFVDEHWVLGFVIPKTSDIRSYSEIESQINNKIYTMIIVQFIVLIAFLLLMFMSLKKK